MTSASNVAASQAGERVEAFDRITIEPVGKPVRAALKGETVAESAGALVMHESGYPPRVYFPRDGVRMELLARSGHKTHCPYKGDASYWTLNVAGETIENAAWAYLEPRAEVAVIEGYLSFVEAVRIEG